jgi:DNA polymerase-3 subunit gamma/tau
MTERSKVHDWKSCVPKRYRGFESPSLRHIRKPCCMSYVVLARKYRPALFADIVGQEHVVRTLANAIKLGRVHHAFLFTGARGVGKTTTARVLAKALNCETGVTPEPCGVCAACVEVTNGSSPDVLEIDGASNTGVDNVRELRDAVRYLPSRGRFKLYIIDEVHMLSTAAFNALLKTLEEPPPHVKFIFATTEPQKIPVTILSRCQRFDFRRVSIPVLVEHARRILEQEGVSLSPSALNAVAREAQGSVRDALSLLDQVLSFAGEHPDDAQVAQALGIVERETIFQLAQALLTRDATRLLSLTAEVDARGHDLADVAGLLVEHFRDLMVVKVTGGSVTEAVLERSPGELEALKAQAEAPSRPDLHRLFAGLVTAAEDVSRSPYPRVTLEMGLLRLLEMEPVASLADLLARLDSLASANKGSSSAGVPPGGRTAGRADRRPAPSGRSTDARPVERQGSTVALAASRAEDATTGAPAQRPQPPAHEAAATGAKPGAASAHGSSELRHDAAEAGGSEPNLAWARLVDRVRQVKPSVASVLEHARVLRFDPQGVELGFPANTFYWESVRDADARSVLSQLLQEQLGQVVPLKLAPLDGDADDAPASLAAMNDESRRLRLQKIQQVALAHPAVREAITVLGGEITEVVPLAEPEPTRRDGS